MLGTSQYPSPAILAEAARASREPKSSPCRCGANRRASRRGRISGGLIRDIGARVLPNTAGCYSVKEAVTTAQMAREVFGTPWVKLEVIGEADTLQPDVFGLVEAARILSADGFRGLPVYDRGSRRRRAADRGRVQGADAVGRADRLRQGAQQRVRLEGAAGAFPRGSADRRCRRRPAVARGGGDGAWLRRRSAQYRRREGGRSCRDGARLRPGDRGGPRRVPRRPNGGARHGGALDAGRRPERCKRCFQRRGEGETSIPSTPSSTAPPGSRRLVGVGARFIQLRVKEKDRDDRWRARRARRWRSAATAGAALVVNDYWRVAID